MYFIKFIGAGAERNTQAERNIFGSLILVKSWLSSLSYNYEENGKILHTLTPVVHLDLRISPRIFEKFETVLMGYSGAWGKLIHEKAKNLVTLSF